MFYLRNIFPVKHSTFIIDLEDGFKKYWHISYIKNTSSEYSKIIFYIHTLTSTHIHVNIYICNCSHPQICNIMAEGFFGGFS